MNDILSDLLLTEPKKLKLKQNTPEWMEIRAKHRTASETPIVMEMSPWAKPYDLARRKFGLEKEVIRENKVTQFGHDHEDAARHYLEARYNMKFTPAVYVRGLYLASVDGISRGKAICEIKCPWSGKRGHTWKETASGSVPGHYMLQIQHQLMVTGAKVCYFIVYDPDNPHDALIRVISPNRDTWKDILKAWEAFEERFGFLRQESTELIP